MFRDSQKLYALRQEEANFIAEITGAQVRVLSKRSSRQSDNISKSIEL